MFPPCAKKSSSNALYIVCSVVVSILVTPNKFVMCALTAVSVCTISLPKIFDIDSSSQSVPLYVSKLSDCGF